MISFIVTPLMAGIMTYVFTHLDILMRGKERARRPLIEFAFDADADEASVADGEVAKIQGESLQEKAIDVEAEA